MIDKNTDNSSVPFTGLPAQWSVRRLDRSRGGDACQGIFLLSTGDRRVVLKVFGPKHGPVALTLAKWDRRVSGRSAPDPVSRFQTERKALDIWRQHGFDVFQSLEGEVDIDIPFPYLVLEYVGGPTLKNFFRDPAIRPGQKRRMLEQFLPEWGRRHLLAGQTADRFLIQEHASFKHVLLSSDRRLITFDFEEVFTDRRSLAFLIGREIAGYLRSLYRVSSAADFDVYLDVLLDGYRPAEFLSYPYTYFFRHPNPLLRTLYAVMRRLPANRQDHSRYSVIHRLQHRLGRRI
jgi:hypothetical protein